jgi:hypothetical protein
MDFTGWPPSRAKRRERFIGEFLICPRGRGAGAPFTQVSAAWFPGICGVALYP